MTNNAYAKYPDDVIKVIESVKVDNPKRVFFNNWAIVGSDIGASTAILVADKIKYNASSETGAWAHCNTTAPEAMAVELRAAHEKFLKKMNG